MEPVLIIGNITCDIIIQVDKLVQLQEDIVAKSQSMCLGGCAYNVANMFHLHRLPYKLISVVGSGLYGDFIKQELKKQGYKHRLYAPEMHGCCYCIVNQEGERSFIAFHGVEYTFKTEWMKPYKNMHFAYAYICGLDIEGKSGDTIIDYLETLTYPIVFAPSPRCTHITKDKLHRLYALNPILHLNAKEACELSGNEKVEDALYSLYAKTNNMVVITLGEKGSVAIKDEEVVYEEAIPCNVVDTIGAGDAHVACVMIKLLEGSSLKEILTYANNMSAKIVSKQGATLTKDEFLKSF